jgi:vitamin B12 transporter
VKCSSKSFLQQACSAAALLFPLGVLAQDAAGTNIDEIVVTGQFIEETIPLEISRYGSRVEIITAEQIRSLGTNDIAETLQMLVPGLFIAPKNGPFDYFFGSIQGSRSEDILWLVDGVRITNRLYNGTTPLDTIPAHMVERIEVLRGGQGIFYGTQSVGGVINVVTKAFSNGLDGAVGMSAHSNDGYNVNLSVRDSIGKHQYVIYGSKDDADGYQPFSDADYQPSSTDRNRGYDVATVGAKYAYNASDRSRVVLSYQYTNNQVDYARPQATATAFNAREEDIAIIKWDFTPNDSISMLLKGYYHTWDSLFTRIDNDLANPGQTITISDKEYWGYEDYGLNAILRYRAAGGMQYVFGLDSQTFSGSDEVLLIADQEETVNAIFVQARTEDIFENTLLAVGARLNSRSDASNATVWNITGKHNFRGSDFYLRGNVGTSFRLPDAWQLFGNDPCCTQGNPALEAEESFNVNLAIGGEAASIAGGLVWELVGFRRTVDNLIGSADGMRINTANEVKITGAEIILQTTFGSSLTANFNVVVTDAEDAGGEQIPNLPEEAVKLNLQYTSVAQPIGAALGISYVGDVYSDVGGFFPTGENVEHGSYTVVNLSGYYDFGRSDQIRLGIRLENALDENYATSVRTSSTDAGAPYLYSNLGVPRTWHVSLFYQF